MKGFKNTTRTQYFTGGDVGGYAKGGMAKAAKPAKAKAPMKKNEGGKVGKMPPIGESVKSGNRMSKMTAADMRALEARFGEKKRPSPADSVKSANRISAQEGAEARRFGVFNEGGKVRKYAEGGPARKTMPPSAPMPDLNETMSNLRNQFGVMGSSGQYDMQSLQDLVNNVGEVYRQRGATPDQVKNAYMQGFANLQKTPSGVGSAPGGPVEPVMKKALPTYNASAAYQQFGASLKDMIDSGQLTLEQANALKAPAFEATRLRDAGQQQQAMDAVLAGVRGRMESMIPTAPRGLSGLALEGLKNASIMKEPLPMMEPRPMLELPPMVTGVRGAPGVGAAPEPPRKIYEPQRPPGMPPTAQPQPYIDSRGRTHFPDGAVLADGPGTVPFPPRPPADFGYGPSEPPTNPLYAELGRGLGNLGPKQPPVDPGFVIGPRDMPSVMPTPDGGFAAAIGGELNNLRPTKVPRTPGGGMGLLGQRQPRMPEKNVTMMKKGGRAAMPKGKR